MVVGALRGTPGMNLANSQLVVRRFPRCIGETSRRSRERSMESALDLWSDLTTNGRKRGYHNGVWPLQSFLRKQESMQSASVKTAGP